MKNDPHFIVSDTPLKEAVCTSVCGKSVTRIASIASDLDLQSVDMTSLTKCERCKAGMADKHYLYIGLAR